MAAVKFTKVRAGLYDTDDREYSIQHEYFEDWCDGPHGNCPGNVEHEKGEWLVFKRLYDDEYEPDEAFGTLREAKAWVEDVYEKARSIQVGLYLEENA
jgi:hypothetical protein